MSSAVNTLKKFVEGHMETRAFEDILYQDPDIEALLSTERPPQFASSSHTLYHYLIALNFGSPIDVLNAQTALGEYLEEQGIEVNVSSDKAEMVELIAAAEPKWLQLDLTYVQTIIEGAPETLLQSALKKWLKQRILELFRYAKKPPRWLQAPAWPIGANGPLVFLGQIAIPDYFHDEAAAYVFHDPVTKQCQTVLQVS
ncbi:hypothetical protein [Paenibacillus sp. GCM10027626]|uniref:hypothetical protein n=1 Tax=Paenibacillus sp. GCM10027626 TaxID=3273411 RepID=UPI00363B8F8D